MSERTSEKDPYLAPAPRREDLDAVYLPTRPDFTITMLGSRRAFRCVSETTFEVVSRRAIDKSGWKCLDAVGLLGVGQCYDVRSTETVVDKAPCVSVDRRTGKVVPVPPTAWNGELITDTVEYTYHRYLVVRTCDSGD